VLPLRYCLTLALMPNTVVNIRLRRIPTEIFQSIVMRNSIGMTAVESFRPRTNEGLQNQLMNGKNAMPMAP
jgi:hypothetical protein